MKKYKKLIYIGVALVLLVLVAVFLLNQYKDRDSLNTESVLTYVMKARVANTSFDYAMANEYYQKARELEPYNSNLLEEYLVFAIMQRDFDTAFSLSQKVVMKYHNHFLANLVLMVAEVKKDNIDSAIQNLGSIGVEKDSLTDVMLILLQSVEAYEKKQPKKFAEIGEKIKALAPDIYYYQIAMNNIMFGNEAQAKKDLFFINNRYVNIDSIVMYSQLLYKTDQDKAINYFDEYLSDNFLSKNKTKEYLDKKVSLNLQEVVSDSLYRISILMSKDINYTYLYSDSVILCNIALMLNDKNIPANLQVASFYEALGNYDLALSIYKSIPQDNYYSRMVLQNVIDIYNQLGQSDKALSFLQETISLDSSNPRPFIESGLIYNKQKLYDKAISAYSEAITLSQDHNFKLGLWLGHFFRGVSYDKSGDWESAEKDLLAAMKINSSDPILVNYLSYSWIDRNKNIVSSMSMLKEAMKTNNNNPNLLDSYSWGLFKMGKYKSAFEYSKKASAILFYDPIIIDHQADILWQLGYKKEAIAAWKKVLNLSPETKLAESVKQKLSGNFPKHLNKKVKEKVKPRNFVERVRSS